VVSWYGTTDFVGQYESMKRSKGGPVVPLLGGTPEEKPEDYKKASPITYLKKDSLPILLVHGNVDPVVPYAQSVLMYEKAKEIGANVEFVTMENTAHSMEPKGEMKPTLEEAQELTANFLLKNLGVQN
jgi:dipeptidyl aminopeptidase/acylaminoacyl peptidase